LNNDFIQSSKLYGTAPKDMMGREFRVGDRAVRARVGLNTIEIVQITEIRDGKVYCAESKVPLNYPGRLLIVNETIDANPNSGWSSIA